MAKIKYTYRTGDSPTHNSPGQSPQSATPVGAESTDPGDYETTKVDRWWRESSFDLMHGLDVREVPMASLPGDWAARFYKR